MITPSTPALRAFVARDLAELATVGGLPPGLAVDDVAAELGADPAAFGRFFLGDPAQETFWCPVLGVEGFDNTIKIWFRDNKVVKLDGEWPELAPGAAAVLGEPELELDHRLDVTVVERGEKVWPSKGIALRMNRSGSLVVSISMFPPTTGDRLSRNPAGKSANIGSPPAEWWPGPLPRRRRHRQPHPAHRSRHGAVHA